jgi:hypothetical protein
MKIFVAQAAKKFPAFNKFTGQQKCLEIPIL